MHDPSHTVNDPIAIPLPGAPPADKLATAEGVLEAALEYQHIQWNAAKPVSIEALLDQFSSLKSQDGAVVDLIYGEYFVRKELGHEIDFREYCRRFPQHANILEQQFALHAALLDPLSLDDGRQRTDASIHIEGYTFIAELGRGGMGIVFKAHQHALRRDVAIKAILAEHAYRDAWRKRFAAEAAAIARLRHPNFVQIYDYGVADGHPYLVLELVEGGTLADRIAGVAQSPSWASETMETLALAIHHAHQQQFVHRDLKPANVLLSEQGVLKITDLGLAVELSDLNELSARHERSTRSLAECYGTPPYMAPEQLSGSDQAVGPPTDIYALGVILYETLTGRVPFFGGSLLETLAKIRDQPVIPPRQLRADIPRDLETICLKCLEKDPRHRYPHAAALANDLRRFRTGLPITARPASAAEHIWRWCRRKPGIAVLATLLLASVTLGLVSMTFMWRQSERLRKEAHRNLADSQANLRLAIGAVDRFCTHVAEDQRMQQHDLWSLRQQLLSTAVDFHHALLAKRQGGPAAKSDLVEAYLRLGRLSAQIDTTSRALGYFAAAENLARDLCQTHRDPLKDDVRLARCMIEASRVRAEMGDAAAAEASLLVAHDLAKVAALRSLPQWLADVDEADREDQTRQDPRFVLAQSLSELGGLAKAGNRAVDAECYLLQAIAAYEDLWKQHPASPPIARELANVHDRLGDLFQTQVINKRTLAEQAYTRSMELLTGLTEQYPLDASITARIVATERDLARLLRLENRTAEAVTELRRAIRSQESVVATHGSVTDFQLLLALLHGDLGQALGVRESADEAVAEVRLALAIVEQLEDNDPADIRLPAQLGKFQEQMACLEQVRRRSEQAVAWWNRAIQTLTSTVQRDPESGSSREILGGAYAERAKLCTRLGDFDAALKDWDQALSRQPEILLPYYQLERAVTLCAAGDYQAATRTAQSILDRLPENSGRKHSFMAYARVLSLAITISQLDPRLSPAEQQSLESDYRQRALRSLEQACAAGFDEPSALGVPEFWPFFGDPDFARIVASISDSPS